MSEKKTERVKCEEIARRVLKPLEVRHKITYIRCNIYEDSGKTRVGGGVGNIHKN